MVLGLIGAGLKLSKSRIAYGIGATYTTVIRGIPELLVVLIIYFGSAGVTPMIRCRASHSNSAFEIGQPGSS